MTEAPNLIIAGAPKCGTTAWAAYLSEHPEVSLGRGKEPHFYCTDFPRFCWASDWEEYLRNFAEAGTARYRIDASPMYLYSKHAAAGIRERAPHARILVFVREPSKFLQSYHAQLLYNRDEVIDDFEEALQAWPDRARGDRVPQTCRDRAFLDYYSVASFGEQVQRLLSHFPEDQVQVHVFEEWIADPVGAYQSILGFLDLDVPAQLPAFQPINTAKQHKSGAVSRLTQQPPTWALRTARLLRRMTGRDRLRLASWIRAKNVQPLQKERLPTDLRRSVGSTLANDRALLEDLTGKDLSQWAEAI